MKIEVLLRSFKHYTRHDNIEFKILNPQLLSSAEPRVFAASNQAPEERASASNHTVYQ